MTLSEKFNELEKAIKSISEIAKKLEDTLSDEEKEQVKEQLKEVKDENINELLKKWQQG